MYLCVWASDLDSDIVHLQRDNVSYIIDWYDGNPIPKYNQALQQAPFFAHRPWPSYEVVYILKALIWLNEKLLHHLSYNSPPQKKHAEQLKKNSNFPSVSADFWRRIGVDPTCFWFWTSTRYLLHPRYGLRCCSGTRSKRDGRFKSGLFEQQ